MKVLFRCLATLVCAASALRGQSEPLVFFNVDVFDGFHMLRGQTVRVRGGMIVDVRLSGERPAGSIDGAGHTFLPGLIDAHCHVASLESLEQAAAVGVTTELDMFGTPAQLVSLRNELERGEHPMPRSSAQPGQALRFQAVIPPKWVVLLFRPSARMTTRRNLWAIVLRKVRATSKFCTITRFPA